MVSTARKGENEVQKYFEKRGYTVSRVSNRRGKHWDLEAVNDVGEILKIEVKTTKKKKFALVDLSDSQVVSSKDKTRIISLKADELWIVIDIKARKPKKPKLYRITRERFERLVSQFSEKISPKLMWKIDDRTAEKYAEKIESKRI
ncbi:MAG: hypothetical protein KAU62_17180 [Candidatus Heimdallarchaeota archaeon]|nr:hypothetical protein [Candidatus Heimdallarchaeota archaeon]MCK4612892.1 hypothetical protein [Candidatus Heimdallarchaeota archaeon]